MRRILESGAVRAAAERHTTTAPTVALAWLAQLHVPMVVLSSSAAHLRRNLRLYDAAPPWGRLRDDEMAALSGGERAGGEAGALGRLRRRAPRCARGAVGRLDVRWCLNLDLTWIEVPQRGLEPASPRAHSFRRAAVRGRKVEGLRFAPSTAQTLDARVERLDPARRGLRPTRRAYLHVGAQALNERLGGSCARAAPRQAGGRPIQRLDSGPPAPLSQPHSGCRSCARRSQTREAEAADSARGPRGVEAARETGGG